MSIRHASESDSPEEASAQRPQTLSQWASRVLLLRRRKPCRHCGRVHGPPMDRCQGDREPSPPQPPADDLNLPWTF